ncbi:hypothetical protein OCOL_001214 [Ordospora colligata]
MVYFDGTLQSLTIAHAIGRFKNKALHEFVALINYGIREEFISILNELGFHKHIILSGCNTNNGIDPLPSGIIDIARESQSHMLIFQVCAEFESVIALRSICSGQGIDSYSQIYSNANNLITVNALEKTKAKEVVYYAYLNNISYTGIMHTQCITEIEAVLLRFIKKMDDRNSLSLFNILNTIRKLVSDNQTAVSKDIPVYGCNTETAPG